MSAPSPPGGWGAALVRTQWETGWVPTDTTIVDRPELLALAVPRAATYLNAVYRVRLDGRSVAARLAHARALVAEVAALHAGRPSRWQLYEDDPHGDQLGSPPELERALAEAGYRATNHHFGYSLPTDVPAPPLPAGLATQLVRDEAGLRDAWAVTDVAFGTHTEHTDAELLQDLAAVRAEPPPVVRVLVRDAGTGETLCHGGLTCLAGQAVGLLWGGGTAPSGRRRGAYRAAVWARVEQASRLGLARVGLFARRETSGPIVAALGFERHGAMVHWERGP